jgi:hypothetical protein
VFQIKAAMPGKILVLRCAGLLACVAFTLPGAAQVDPGRYLEDVKSLASDAFKGRGNGTPELEKAGEFLAGQFQSMGIKPVSGNSYYQAFPLSANVRAGSRHRFEYSQDGTKVALKFREDFIDLGVSASGSVTAGVVFVGYGITAPEYNYDDYAGIAASGKIVLVLRHEPQEHDAGSIFSGRAYTRYSQLVTKVANASRHGAAGLILIGDRAAHPGGADEFEQVGRAIGPADAGIPAVEIKTAVAEHWAGEAGKNLDEIEGEIDKDLRPRSFDLPVRLHVSITTEIRREVKTVHNIAAYLPGQTGEYLILGAHYDHLGLGEQDSLAPDMVGLVHPGADDNASGTSGVIELARRFSGQPPQKRGILFLLFAGEELGLLGSAYYADHPELPLDEAVAMLNMDMIGRVREGKVYVDGTGTGTSLKQILDECSDKYHFRIDLSDTSSLGSSDHSSFEAKLIPILFFFSGLHEDYHRPSDTWDKIDAPTAAKLLGMIGDMAEKLIESPARPEFVRQGGKAVGRKPAAGGRGAAAP